MNTLLDAHERFSAAARILTRDGDLTERLIAAIGSQASHAFTQLDVLPEELQERINDLREGVAPTTDEGGSLRARIERMELEELEHWASEVLNVALGVAELVGRGIPAMNR